MAMIDIPEDLMHKEIEVGRFAVTADDIRVFAEAVDDLNPLYLDPEAARQAGYPNVIAPPTYCMHLRGNKVVPEIPLAPGLASLYAGQEFEFHDELYADRTYTVTARLADVYEKTGRSGPLGVIVREMLVKDESGSTVMILRERQMVRSPHKKI
jgi:acyl dehydratase